MTSKENINIKKKTTKESNELSQDKKDSNASSSLFGWDFQINAAISLFIENIERVDTVRLEGGKEDIEIKLNNGKTIYAQAKSVERRDDYSNIISKLSKGLVTLNNGNKEQDAEKLIYITNSPNPFNNKHTMYAFIDRTRKCVDDLPPECKTKLIKIIEDLKINETFPQELFRIDVLPFESSIIERYKAVQSEVSKFFYNLNKNQFGIADKVLDVWQKEIFKNGTLVDTSITLDKSSLIWPIIAISADCNVNEDIFEGYEPCEIEEMVLCYRDVINVLANRYLFCKTIISDYSDFRTSSKKLAKDFIEENWKNYKEYFEIETSDEIREVIIKLTLQKVISNKSLIGEIKKKVNL